ncbi:YebC/PmpR family DNA-binding transcriptional regulator [Rhodothermus profundi]|uniref:Probable transcriptional regulatory protein SAMN04488087_0996 n=1 Tax=Rhodothermus profundi TaxID=633813 RepID=A0A1M6RX54_9BACT|nr:YebC/PmpR family DNA-binding transcriptional regulator [Rhodothermus profundi]SHK37094.1 DNA-binding regulatory protein, YebC/PmpR family [Rhodothermus profundi]
MAGHNKWSKVKRQKAVVDARKSKIWARLSRDIIVAAREGGGDPEANPRLAQAIERAKAENMPKENIERAIKRGTGEIQGEDYVEVTYEGYAPGGVAVFIEALTDNTNRTVSEIRHLFTKAGGSLGQPGSVAYLFERKGIIEISAADRDELELFELVAEAGAEDLTREDDTFVVTTSVEAFADVLEALRSAGIEPLEAGLQRVPTTTVTLPPEEAKKVVALLEALEAHQDVQNVYTTLNFDEATLAAIS